MSKSYFKLFYLPERRGMKGCLKIFAYIKINFFFLPKSIFTMLFQLTVINGNTIIILAQAVLFKSNQRYPCYPTVPALVLPCLGVGQPCPAQVPAYLPCIPCAAGGTARAAGQPSPLSPSGRMSVATAPCRCPGEGKEGTLPLATRSNSLLPWPRAAPKPWLAGPGAADHFSASD